MMNLVSKRRSSACPSPTGPANGLNTARLITLIWPRALAEAGWLTSSQARHPILAISSLNTYNLLFLMLGGLLHWRPRKFLDAVAKAEPALTGVLIQFPFYGGIAAMITAARAPVATGRRISQHTPSSA